MTDNDTRVWMYLGPEGRLFAHPDEIPAGEDWRDSPYEMTVEEAKPKKAKAKKTEGENGNSN